MDDKTYILMLKIISFFSIFGLCFIFGILPMCIVSCRTNTKFLSFANTFSGGLFLGIGVIHLLPEASEKFQKISKFPFAYCLSFVSYAFILFIQKVIFGFASKLQEELEDSSGRNSVIETKKKLNEIDSPLISSKIDKSKFITEDRPSILNLKNEDENNENNENHGESMEITQTREIDKKERPNNKKITSYILMVALGFHGIFECLALGIQTDANNTILLLVALLIHKWAESLTLGVSFIKGNISKKLYYILMTCFCLIGPLGIVIGIFLSSMNNTAVEGSFLSLSVGTFIYVSCSEVIVEEFGDPNKRYSKFFIFLFGGLFAVGLNIFEYLTENQ